MVEVVCNNN